MKSKTAALLFAILFFCFPAGCRGEAASDRSYDSCMFVWVPDTLGASVTNAQGQERHVDMYGFYGDMECSNAVGSIGMSPGAISFQTNQSELFCFQLPAFESASLDSSCRSVSIETADSKNSQHFMQTASLYSGTATLYLDGSVVLDGDLTEFEVRVQLPEDQKHQWVIEGNGAEQDHVEIYFKNGEPMVESINDDLTYTVEKEEYSR